MYTLIKKEGKARRGKFETVHGTFQTPCFMNVGTAAAIKGGISSIDLVDLKCQVDFAIHIICICVLLIRSSGKWAAFISL